MHIVYSNRNLFGLQNHMARNLLPSLPPDKCLLSSYISIDRSGSIVELSEDLINVYECDKTSFLKNFEILLGHETEANKTFVSLLKETVETQNELEIIYRGGSHKGEWRPIRPVSLLPMPNGNMLYAHCLLSDIYKSFALHKIQDVRLNLGRVGKIVPLFICSSAGP